MKKPNVWKIGGVIGIVLGLALILLAGGRTDGYFAGIFRQCWTGFFFIALGAAALYADAVGAEDESDDVQG